MKFTTIAIFFKVLLVGASEITIQPPETSQVLAVKRIKQETDMWCWAASAQMILEFFGTSITQCDQATASKCFPHTEYCCGATVPGNCVNGGWPAFGDYGYTNLTTTDAPLTFEQIKEQIAHSKPVAFSWHWLDQDGNLDGGHMMVIYGWEMRAGIEYVWIHDPSQLGEYEGLRSYSAYVSGTEYSHWNDFYEISRN